MEKYPLFTTINVRHLKYYDLLYYVMRLYGFIFLKSQIMKKLIFFTTLCCLLMASCSTKKLEQLTNQISQLKAQISETKQKISTQEVDIMSFQKDIKEVEREMRALSKDTVKLNNEMGQLNKTIANNKEIAERAKSRPKSKGRSVSDAGPEDKRFTVENGVVRY